ncbi:sigma-54-dependent Fis family transcriptional regulator [Ideonella livida]|uniref:Sigma-54-dependent Fis family transcriptional regulator n=1 Tax=Ideonella livida TaxID=2707176 RepID=A0A7C9TKR2_9BURK|nr:sigma-54-dependent Fis family transcriptional regulator [Ideonella livida]NDY92678.1 sigma-54-dependent Fis family transcriptional regulator [Ideonella livida]
MPTLPPPTRYRPEQIWQARHAFFDDGHAPDGLVDAPVLSSWQRLRELGRAAHESVVFDPVEAPALRRLLAQQQALLRVAQPELARLAASVAEAGYAVLLTDALGRAVAVDGAIQRASAPLRQAFRPGVDLSERMIGTNAMSAALLERRPVWVQGGEHFFADNQIFHCCAAPVFDPQGRVVGAVDLSRDTPGLAAGALGLVQRCARRIEQRLFDDQPAWLQVQLEGPDAGPEAWLAFDADAQLLGATSAALPLLGLPQWLPQLAWADLFEDRFDALHTAARQGRPLPLRLRGGVRLQARGRLGGTAAAHRPQGGRIAGHPAATRPATEALACAAPLGHARSQQRLAQALRALEAGLPLLITGETGVGKEVAARALHTASRRAGAPFLAVNCGAITPTLMAAELFGHVEGAFTGARRGGQAGRIEAAHGGTLLLDEIGDMPLELQVGLLRVLDRQEVVRVGATQAVTVDVRFVCATHRHLPTLVAQGRFREDLYHRLAAFTLHLPPLREREDFDAVLDGLLAPLGCAAERLNPALRAWLRRQPWPGNVRQLALALRTALALSEPDEPLQPQHFGQDDEATGGLPPRASSAQPAVAPSDAPATAPTDAALHLPSAREQAIQAALARTGGNVTAAAALLGLGRATLYRHLARGR